MKYDRKNNLMYYSSFTIDIFSEMREYINENNFNSILIFCNYHSKFRWYNELKNKLNSKYTVSILKLDKIQETNIQIALDVLKGYERSIQEFGNKYCNGRPVYVKGIMYNDYSGSSNIDELKSKISESVLINNWR